MGFWDYQWGLGALSQLSGLLGRMLMVRDVAVAIPRVFGSLMMAGPSVLVSCVVVIVMIANPMLIACSR